MHFDTFFSISRTPVGGDLPSEAEMFRNFFNHDCARVVENMEVFMRQVAPQLPGEPS